MGSIKFFFIDIVNFDSFANSKNYKQIKMIKYKTENSFERDKYDSES